MRFRKGILYPHPPRGRARKRYRMSDEALAQRRRNLLIARERGRLWRGHSESQVIRRLIRQWVCDPQPKPSARALARKLRVWPSYVRRVARKGLCQGADVPAEQRVTWDELARARELTELGRFRMPDLFTPAPPSPPENKHRADGPAPISVEEYERQRREDDIAAALERLRARLKSAT
jgi:hypothetical protein